MQSPGEAAACLLALFRGDAESVEAEIGALLLAEGLLAAIHYSRGLAEAARRSK